MPFPLTSTATTPGGIAGAMQRTVLGLSAVATVTVWLKLQCVVRSAADTSSSTYVPPFGGPCNGVTRNTAEDL